MIGNIITIGLLLSGAMTGNEVLKRVDENATPRTQISTAEMTIIHRSGSKRVREVRIWMKGDDHTLVKFLSPADIRGTGFLSVKNNNWLYLPVLKRVRRIAGKERRGSFMGTDFTYEDISEPSFSKKYSARLLSTQKYNKRPCYLLELLPKGETSYSKLRLWVDKENFYPVKTEYYDSHKKLLKIRYILEVVKIKGFWIAKRVEMENVQKESKTLIVFKDIKVNPEIPSYVFTTRYLERGVR